jgi:hypothetical protein
MKREKKRERKKRMNVKRVNRVNPLYKCILWDSKGRGKANAMRQGGKKCEIFPKLVYVNMCICK